MNTAPAPDTLAPLRLKKDEERRLRAGHLWIYSNEVDTAATPLKAFTAGQQVQVLSHSGKPLGNAYVNPNSLICARLFSRDCRHPLDRSLIVHRLNIALSLREQLFDAPYYRLVYGEADQLPGLVIDRYDTVCVVQCTTAGMEAIKDEVLAAIDKVLKPAGILWRADSPVRQLEGLDSYRDVQGDIPALSEVVEQGVRFSVSLLEGQKTGWFYDQRMNRERMRQYVAGKRVLDVFSYVGAWGVQAAAAGADEVMCVDASEAAIDRIHDNAAANGVGNKVATIQGDAFDVLSQLRIERERFDVVILDPPAFIKRKKDMKAGEQAYHRLNQLGMQLASKDAILISASCSQHLEEQRLQKILLQSSRHIDRSLQLLERGQQAPDHPVHPAIPETRYLKAFFCRVLPS